MTKSEQASCTRGQVWSVCIFKVLFNVHVEYIYKSANFFLETSIHRKVHILKCKGL